MAPLRRAMSHAVRGAGFHAGATTLRTFHHLQGPLCYTAGAAASSPSHRAGPGVDFLESVLIAVSVLLQTNPVQAEPRTLGQIALRNTTSLLLLT